MQTLAQSLLALFVKRTCVLMVQNAALPSSVDTDEHPKLAKTFSVRNVPFLTLLEFGERLHSRPTPPSFPSL